MTFEWRFSLMGKRALAGLGMLSALAIVPAAAATDEPETIIIGGAASQGPAVSIDLRAIDEALGRQAPSNKLQLVAPGTRPKPSRPAPQLKLTANGAPKLHLAQAAPAKPKLPPVAPVATESAAPMPSRTNLASAPTAPVEKAKLDPAPEAAKPAPIAAATPSPIVPAQPVAPKAAVPAPAEVKVAIATPPAASLPAPAPSAPTSLAPAAPASVPAASVPAASAGRETRLLFQAEADNMQDAARLSLDALAEKLKANDARAQIIAYAAGTADQSSAARRLSLKRALGVREYLISKGIRSQRMDLRALGNESGEGPPDRVDVVIDPR
jgi:outer membrane protein OmpA-like peptidoglycan-associated protein